MKMRRYSVRAWLSFDVEEGETPKQVLNEIESSYDNNARPGHGVFVGIDDAEIDRYKDDLATLPDDEWDL